MQSSQSTLQTLYNCCLISLVGNGPTYSHLISAFFLVIQQFHSSARPETLCIVRRSFLISVSECPLERGNPIFNCMPEDFIYVAIKARVSNSSKLLVDPLLVTGCFGHVHLVSYISCVLDSNALERVCCRRRVWMLCTNWDSRGFYKVTLAKRIPAMYLSANWNITVLL